MASIAVTYTFVAGATSSASNVNSNFTDIVNGLSDGTKDLSISALTCAGNVTFNANMTLGNASGDTITMTGSVASHVNPSAHNTYDFGTVTTLGWRALFLASSSATKTAKLLGPATSSDIIVTMPAITGTLALEEASITKSTTYTAAATDDIILATTASAWTLTLPAAASYARKTFTVKKMDNTPSISLTIDGNASETIDGATTTTINTQYEVVKLYCDGSNWHILDRIIPSVRTAWTPTGAFTTNTTYTGYWWRTGDSMHCEVNLAFAGAPNSVTFDSVTLPLSVTIDTAKLTQATAKGLLAGSILSMYDDDTSGLKLTGSVGGVIYQSTTLVQPVYGIGSPGNTVTLGAITQAAPQTIAANDIITFSFSIPISGWKG